MIMGAEMSSDLPLAKPGDQESQWCHQSESEGLTIKNTSVKGQK